MQTAQINRGLHIKSSCALHRELFLNITIISRNLLHLPTSVNSHQDTVSHILVVHQWQVCLMHNLIPGVVLKFFSANIVLIVSYLLIVQSIICYKNQKHFNQFTMSLLFCVILFYIIFLVSAAASVSTEQRSTGPLVPLYFPLSEFVNTGGTI